MLLLILIGLAVLCAGRLRLTRSACIKGRSARIYGLILLLGAVPLHLVVAFVLNRVCPQSLLQHPIWPWAINYAVMIVFPILLAVPFARKPGAADVTDGAAGPPLAVLAGHVRAPAAGSPGCWVGGLAITFAAWNLLSLAAGGFVLAVTLPEILEGTSDDWGLAFMMIAGGIGAIANFALLLPAELLFAVTARNIDWRLRAPIPATLALAVLLGAAPSAVTDLRCYAHYGEFPAEAGIGWALALGIGVFTYGAAALAYLLVRKQRASRDSPPTGQ